MSSVDHLLPERYEYTGTKFKGGQGYVYVCRDKNLNRDVAVKLFSVGKFAKYNLQDELTALNCATSKHVVMIYAILSTNDGKHKAIVEEYVPGNDLSGIKFSSSQITDYLKTIYQISCGLRDIHRLKVIHRDIKPSNMKFDAEGLVKILDFGFAHHGDSTMTTKGHGTDGYRAPEIYDLPSKINNKVDVYAFGVTAWALLGGLPKELLVIPPQYPSQVPSISSALPDLNIPAINIIDACLEVDPSKRPSMGEVGDQISACLLYNQHRGLLVDGATVYELNSSSKGVKIQAISNEVHISYDGYSFVITATEGDVYINNMPAKVGTKLPASSVITLGAQSLGYHRRFFSFDISNPEVIL